MYISKESGRRNLLETDKVVIDLRISRFNPGCWIPKQRIQRGGAPNAIDSTEDDWEARPGGIWLRRSSEPHVSDSKQALTSVDVLFGADAVDPRPQWGGEGYFCVIE